MERVDYQARIVEMTDPAYVQGWNKLSSDLRVQAKEVRDLDATMAFLEQGLAVSIDRLLAHVSKRRAEQDRAEAIIKNAEPIDSEPDLSEIEEEEQS